MRNLLQIAAAGLMLALAPVCRAADTYTPNYNFRLPDLDVEDEETPWGQKINNNFTLADSALNTIKLSTGAIDAAKLSLTGGTMTGPIIMQSSITFSTGSIENVNYVQLNTSFVDGTSEGRLQWNSSDGTPEIGMPGGNVNLQIGQENLIRVKAGEDIGNGQIVYISSAAGQRPVIYLADADAVDPLARCPIGLATEDIAQGNNGYITTFGLLRSTNTTGYIEGASFYLSTTKGNWTATMPVTPTRIVPMGVVVYTHGTEGIVLVSPRVVPQQVVVSSLTATELFTTGNSSFTSTASTMTVAGYIDIGVEYLTKSETGPTLTGTLTCSPGKYILGGGCNTTDSAVATLRENYPSANNAWTCTQTGSFNTMLIYAICGRVKP